MAELDPAPDGVGSSDAVADKGLDAEDVPLDVDEELELELDDELSEVL